MFYGNPSTWVVTLTCDSHINSNIIFLIPNFSQLVNSKNMVVCVSVCIDVYLCVYMSVCTMCGCPWRTKEGVEPLQQMVASLVLWVLGPEPGSSGRAISSLSHLVFL